MLKLQKICEVLFLCLTFVELELLPKSANS